MFRVHSVDRRCGRRLTKGEGRQTGWLEGGFGERDVVKDMLRGDVGIVVRDHSRSIRAR